MSVLAVAHRAGNSLAALRAAVELGADVVECDVHHVRGRLEVRHSKALGPLPWLWDRSPWELVRRDAWTQLHLDEVLEAARVPLMLDLKGAGKVGHRTARLLASRARSQPLLVCARWWPSVEAVADVPGVRAVLSARNTGELARLRRRVRAGRAPYAVSLHGSLLSAPVVGELRQGVELVLTWGVEDLPRLERVVEVGVNGVISSSPEVLRRVKSLTGPG